MAELQATLHKPSKPLPGTSPAWALIAAHVLLGAAVLAWAYAILSLRP